MPQRTIKCWTHEVRDMDCADCRSEDAHQLEAQPSLVEREVLRLIVMHDDGEHEPHEAEQCGIFTCIEDVRAYVERRFADTAFKADIRPSGEAWHLIDCETGKDSDLVLIVRHETLYAPAALQPASPSVDELVEALRPFAEAGKQLASESPTDMAVLFSLGGKHIRICDLRRAATTIAAQSARCRMTEQATPPDVEELVEKLKPALALLPVECHDTPDYAEATGPQFQAMTMRPDAFLALNVLPQLLEALAAMDGQRKAKGGEQ